MSSELALQVAAVLGGTGVALGAFGNHALKKIVSDPARAGMWGTAVRYQLYHALALLAIGLSGRENKYAVYLWSSGSIMFALSIYLLVFFGERVKKIALITPTGGTLMVAGWFALFFM